MWKPGGSTKAGVTPGILWTAVTRGSTVIAEAGEDTRGGLVLNLAKRILEKRPGPGWEFERMDSLRAIKFHIHDRIDESGSTSVMYVYAICCVYDWQCPEMHAKGYVGKIALLSAPLRATLEWQSGSSLAAQQSFAPNLIQQMQQVPTPSGNNCQGSCKRPCYCRMGVISHGSSIPVPRSQCCGRLIRKARWRWSVFR